MSKINYTCPYCKKTKKVRRISTRKSCSSATCKRNRMLELKVNPPKKARVIIKDSSFVVHKENKHTPVSADALIITPTGILAIGYSHDTDIGSLKVNDHIGFFEVNYKVAEVSKGYLVAIETNEKGRSHKLTIDAFSAVRSEA